ncbi:P-loop containing nucleoside triphosphate hydrolase protein [Mycotypha africana]|uniref:P-loop containing nucleoside triphosphate hydrolase protein n=1 Tax=Mycotypha africana TaxID=64632 RepID=UPI0023003A6C|nr:P-loop containing nucleoside triphosphate hydrolase protein [Mycotypha africana]KAI8987349.1 P-loop containing nucleoside triphosphate hydrolase protein [Mycotypha africana]
MASNTAQGDVDEFDDDDLDLEELLEVVQTVEQQHAATTTTAEDRTISFVSSEDDPTPPPPLPPSTACHHKFDPENLRTWIYPVNYPLRGYQLNIVKKALFHNTLVALPTGLGKTFIAAVVMYNYYRWFPESIIIFMAPTRPLVEQQIEACHKICGLQETTLLMGTTSAAKRTLLWRDNRVFFATPQTVEKDIASRQFPLEKVACVVVDEAHRATGNFAYSVVIRKLAQRNKHFRVLALTATPGSTLDAVQDVITNLQITNIQIRTEDSMDIREFSHGKNIQNITVRLDYTEGSTGLLPRIINDYRNKVFQPLLDDLARKPSGVQPDIDQVTPYGLMSKRNYFMATAKNLNASLKFSIFQSFLMAEAVCRAYDRLCHHGIGSFVDTVQNKLEEFKKTEESGKKLKKAEIAFKNNHHLQNILTMAKRAMENPDFAGHPKIDRMVSILIHHFTSLAQGEASKVMVFSTYRSSVTEICKVLDRHRPIIRCSPFVGQSMDKKGAKGLNQREQQEVIQKFKKDEINVIVATSIGEEGLDIGEVDLIICYDSESSPIRMLQRMGRTGRKRQGKCILLLTQSEEKKYARAKEAYAKIQQLIARGCNLNYYKPNPPVLPANYKPTICRKVLTVRPYVSSTSVNKRKRNNQQTKYTAEGYLQPAAQRTFIESFSDSQGQRFTNIEEIKDRYWPAYNTKRSLSKYLPLQAQAKSTFRVDHSHRTIRFTGLINRIEQRILNPDKRIRLNVSSTGNDDRPGDNILVLPSKSKPSISIVTRKSSKATVKTEQRRLHDWQNEADMAEFMEQQNIRQIVGIDNESSFENSFSLSLPFNEIEQPRKESKILLSPVRNMPTKVTKGKEKQ